MPITSLFGCGGKSDHLLAHIGRGLLLLTALVVLLLLPSPAWAPLHKWFDVQGTLVSDDTSALTNAGMYGGKSNPIH